MDNIEVTEGTLDPTGCISNAWEALKPNYPLFLGMVVVFFLILIVLGCLPFVGFILLGPLTCGIYYACLKQIRNEQVDFSMMFKGFEVFLPAMIVGLVISIPQIINQIINIGIFVASIGAGVSQNEEAIQATNMLSLGSYGIQFLLYIPMLLLSLVFFFSYQLTIDRKVTALEAFKLSFAGLKKNLVSVIVLFILEILIGIAGMLVLCVGFFLVLPLIFMTSAEAYRQVFPSNDINTIDAPPAPNEYNMGN